MYYISISVTGVHGSVVSLPCDIAHPPKDSIMLLLWFKEGLTTPIYRLVFYISYKHK